MAARVEVDGLRELTSSLGRLGRDLADTATVNARAGALVVTTASRLAPRRTGRLAASGHADPTSARVAVSWPLPYAGPINYGVGPRRGRRGPHNIRASRFATNAIERTQDTWMGYYESDVRTKVNQVRGA